MSRSICGLAALGASLLLALPASAEPSRVLSGALVSVSSTHVTVKGERVLMRCAVGKDSPSVAGYAAGDRIQVACKLRPSGRPLLLRIRHLIATGADTSPGTSPTRVEFAGAITVLGATRINLHDGDRDLACSIGSSSPSTGEAKVGDHAKVICTAGVLTSFQLIVRTVPPPAPAPEPPAPATAAVVAYGLISALTSTSLTIHNDEHGDLTCTLGERSPRLGDFHVGDRVKLGCTDGRVLVSIARY